MHYVLFGDIPIKDPKGFIEEQDYKSNKLQSMMDEFRQMSPLIHILSLVFSSENWLQFNEFLCSLRRVVLINCIQ